MRTSDTVLPPSVVEWLSNSTVRMSVNSILSVQDNELPAGLLWEEIRTYHEARAVAKLTRSEWAIALFDLWNHIWGSQIGRDWQVRDLAELKRFDEWLTEEDLWDERAITVSHRRGETILYTALELQPDRVVLAFGLEPEFEDRPLVMNQPDPFLWAEGKKHDWTDWNYWSKGGSIVSDTEMLAELTRAASEALKVCEDQLRQR